MNNDKTIQFFRKHYSKRLRNALKSRGCQDAGRLSTEYQKRFLKYMSEADFGANNERFTSYLNIFSGLAAYELLQEHGFSKQESVAVYDYMCSMLRKVAALAYRVADLFPNGFQIAVNSLKEDMIGAKAVCWETQVLQDTQEKFEYRITKCLYYDTCKAHGYRSLRRYSVTMTDMRMMCFTDMRGLSDMQRLGKAETVAMMPL